MGTKWFVDYIPIENVECVLLVVLSVYQVGMLSVFNVMMECWVYAIWKS